MSVTPLICPKCDRIGCHAESLWYADQPKSTTKCRRCGQWIETRQWRIGLHPNVQKLLAMREERVKP